MGNNLAADGAVVIAIGVILAVGGTIIATNYHGLSDRIYAHVREYVERIWYLRKASNLGLYDYSGLLVMGLGFIAIGLILLVSGIGMLVKYY